MYPNSSIYSKILFKGYFLCWSQISIINAGLSCLINSSAPCNTSSSVPSVSIFIKPMFSCPWSSNFIVLTWTGLPHPGFKNPFCDKRLSSIKNSAVPLKSLTAKLYVVTLLNCSAIFCVCRYDGDGS